LGFFPKPYNKQRYTMSFALTGKPPQDLSLSNLAVKDTLVATSVTAVNVNAPTINGLSTGTGIEAIRSIFTGAEFGQWTVSGGIGRITINGIINDGPDPVPGGTVLGQIDNYGDGGRLVTFPGFIYCPAAPNIAQAGFLATFQIDERGQFSTDAPVDLPGDRGQGDVRCVGGNVNPCMKFRGHNFN
jgi:hypothetical protein